MHEIDRSEHPFRQTIMQSEIENKDGVVQIPDGPGLSIKINRDVLAEYAVQD